MNWLDPEEVRKWLECKSFQDERFYLLERPATFKPDLEKAAVEFVKACAAACKKDGPPHSDADQCCMLIARRLEGGDEG